MGDNIACTSKTTTILMTFKSNHVIEQN